MSGGLFLSSDTGQTVGNNTIVIGGPFQASMYTDTNGFNLGVLTSAPFPDSRNPAQFTLNNLGKVGIGTTSPSAKLQVYDTSSLAVFDVQGSQGQLFSVTDDLTGTIFAASDISGIPILSVDAAGTVDIDGTLDVDGTLNVTGDFTVINPNGVGGSGSDLTLNTASSFLESNGYQVGIRADNAVIISPRNTGGAIYIDASTTGTILATGTFNVDGTKNFRIDHPIKPETHDLVHTVIESNRGDLIYRGKTALTAGTATINLDQEIGMTEGTFEALVKDLQVFTTNEDGWTLTRGRVEGNSLIIEAQDNTCTETISWLVIGERKDDAYINSNSTDENGNLIIEVEAEGLISERGYNN